LIFFGLFASFVSLFFSLSTPQDGRPSYRFLFPVLPQSGKKPLADPLFFTFRLFGLTLGPTFFSSLRGWRNNLCCFPMRGLETHLFLSPAFLGQFWFIPRVAYLRTSVLPIPFMISFLSDLRVPPIEIWSFVLFRLFSSWRRWRNDVPTSSFCPFFFVRKPRA